MSESTAKLSTILDGWQGYQQSMVNAVKPLTPDQLRWRPAENFNSVGELVRHISLGRIEWFMRMSAPGSEELASQVLEWEEDEDGNRHIVESAFPIAENPGALVIWLENTWQMIEQTIHTWTVSDIAQTYPHRWNGKIYTPSRQWTIWRIMNHDLHHGGELSLMLGLQGIEAFELSALFGHIVLPG
jgi:uncharacterized damage-inducible protein DinB